jgi:hypothetical protein
MGAVDFMHVEKGDDPSKIFERLCDDATRRYGTDPYNGKINQCCGMERRKSDPLPLSEAKEFANEDTRENRKRGPAFYIPYSQETKEEQAEFQLRLGALTAESAKKQMRKRAKNKVSKIRGADIRVDILRDFEQDDSGTLPELDRERPAGTDRERKEVWKVQTEKSSSWPENSIHRKDFESESAARSAIKEYFRKYPTHDITLSIYRKWTDEIEHFSLEGEEPSSKPMWSGTVRVTQTKTNSETRGYIFYGMAPW